MPHSPGRAARTIDHALVDMALSGLSGQQKTLPAKLFYDEEGCRLFYRITELPEYYLTRTERTLLPEVARHVLAQMPAGSVLVEYGASDEGKAAFLLDSAASGQQDNPIRAYVPIDVAMPALVHMCARLAKSHRHIAVHPIAADFMDPVILPASVAAMPRLGFFPGSTIGNLDRDEATRFLASARGTLGADAFFLIGADLRKDPAILLPAYNDSEGVTAAFNRNVLIRLNREAGAEFDVDSFEHRAIWNDAESRIEMHLVSRRNQTVRIAGHRVEFARGESIHTENSYKYAPDRLVAIGREAGWRCRSMWSDPANLFVLYLLDQIKTT